MIKDEIKLPNPIRVDDEFECENCGKLFPLLTKTRIREDGEDVSRVAYVCIDCLMKLKKANT